MGSSVLVSNFWRHRNYSNEHGHPREVSKKLTGYRQSSATSPSTASQAKGIFRGFGGMESLRPLDVKGVTLARAAAGLARTLNLYYLIGDDSI